MKFPGVPQGFLRRVTNKELHRLTETTSLSIVAKNTIEHVTQIENKDIIKC